MGEGDLQGLPGGFVRLVDEYGNIYEGNFTPDGRMNGFCVVFSGGFERVEIGWYKDDREHGNCMTVDAYDRTIKSSGWYYEGAKKGPMKSHPKLKSFKIEDILTEPPPPRVPIEEIKPPE